MTIALIAHLYIPNAHENHASFQTLPSACNTPMASTVEKGGSGYETSPTCMWLWPPTTKDVDHRRTSTLVSYLELVTITSGCLYAGANWSQFLLNLLNLLCLRVVQATMTTTQPITLPLAHARLVTTL